MALAWSADGLMGLHTGPLQKCPKVLGWATAMKYRTGENPAAWTGAQTQRAWLTTSGVALTGTPAAFPICHRHPSARHKCSRRKGLE